MLMSLKDAWKRWSFKAAVIAAVLNALLAVLAMYQYAFNPMLYGALNAAIGIAIAYFRIVPQKSL